MDNDRIVCLQFDDEKIVSGSADRNISFFNSILLIL